MPRPTPASIAALSDAVVPAPPTAPRPRGPLHLLVRDGPTRLAAAVLALIGLAALVAPLVAHLDPLRQFDVVALKLQPPSAEHWLGTDPSSRDVLSRVVHGARISLSVALLAVTLSLTLGTLVGAIAGFFGGVVDGTLMRAVDALLAIPRLLLLLAVVSLWGQLSAGALILLIGLTGWFSVSRLVRAEVVALRERDFVRAARALGARRRAIIVRHILPHLAAPLAVIATLGVGNVIVVEAGLSFLGFGVPEPQPSWGTIIRDGREVIETAWWLTLFPGLAMAATVLSVNVIADRLRAAVSGRHLPRR